MPDWRSGMSQTYEYYVVDPVSWKDKSPLTNVISCKINRDDDSETLGSASFSITDSIGEDYIRVYLVTVQNGVKERFALGTYLIQTPTSTFDGKVRSVTVDAYTPLLELKESMPPLGYTLMEGDNVMERAYHIVKTSARAPVVKTTDSTNLLTNFVANTDDTWISFTEDLITNAKYHFDLDEMGRILFAPDQDTASLQPVWTYDDGNSSILYPDISIDHDLYDVPNAVEVIYSENSRSFHAKVVNDDPNSPISTVNRGREKLYRDTSPSFAGIPSQKHIDEYAERLLKQLSSIEYRVSYSHGYCPVRVGDCVRLNYKAAGLTNVKAKVVSQSISCEPGCPVNETAVFTTKLWG